MNYLLQKREIRTVTMSHHKAGKGIGFLSNKYIPPRESRAFTHVLALELQQLSM